MGGVRFSVLIPAYNREKYIRQTVDSVLSQTFPNVEVVVVDDGSTDGTPAILESYGSRIKAHRQANCGAEVARNTAAAIAQGEYLVLLDSDDFLFPHALSVLDRVIRNFNSPPLVLGRELYYQDGQPVPAESANSGRIRVLKFRDYLSKTIALSNFNSKLAIRKSVFEAVGGCRKSTPQTWFNDDLNLMLKVGIYGPFFVLQEPYTVAYRQHDSNTIRNVKAIAEGLLRIAEAERRGEYPGGAERRSDRYAAIGGRASTWAMKYCARAGDWGTALRLLFGTAPMVAAATWRRLGRIFGEPLQPVVLLEERAASESDAEVTSPEAGKARGAGAGARAGS